MRKFEPGIDYSADVEETFAKFKKGAVKDYRVKFYDHPDMNHIFARAFGQMHYLASLGCPVPRRPSLSAPTSATASSRTTNGKRTPP